MGELGRIEDDCGSGLDVENEAKPIKHELSVRELPDGNDGTEFKVLFVAMGVRGAVDVQYISGERVSHAGLATWNS